MAPEPRRGRPERGCSGRVGHPASEGRTRRGMRWPRPRAAGIGPRASGIGPRASGRGHRASGRGHRAAADAHSCAAADGHGAASRSPGASGCAPAASGTQRAKGAPDAACDGRGPRAAGCAHPAAGCGRRPQLRSGRWPRSRVAVARSERLCSGRVGHSASEGRTRRGVRWPRAAGIGLRPTPTAAQRPMATEPRRGRPERAVVLRPRRALSERRAHPTRRAMAAGRGHRAAGIGPRASGRGLGAHSCAAAERQAKRGRSSTAVSLS